MARPTSFRWLLIAALLGLLTAACASASAVAEPATDDAAAAIEQADVAEQDDVPVEDDVADVATAQEPSAQEPVAEETVPTTTVAEDVPFEGSGASDGDLVLVSAEEVVDALTGNTIIGNWLGEDYRQFFAESGTTIYRPVESGQEQVGQWRINAEADLYESLWGGRPPWDQYEVHRDGDTWFWTGGGVQLSPFSIVEGDQLADR